MTATLASHAASALASHIVAPAIRSLLFAGAAGLALVLSRTRDVSLRLALWTAVLGAALAMPALTWILPSFNVPLPGISNVVSLASFSTHADRSRVPDVAPSANARGIADEGGSQPSFRVRSPHTFRSYDTVPSNAAWHGRRREFAASANPARSGEGRAALWLYIAVGSYFLVLGVLLVRVTTGIVCSFRLVRSARQVRDSRAWLLMEERLSDLGLRRAPILAESVSVGVPLTLALPRAAILIPEGWREWEDGKLRAVIAHELAHVARRDALVRLISLLHQCFFWFSPLPWWLHRKLSELAEQASDEAALGAGTENSYYAEVLMGFFHVVAAKPGRVEVSMAQGETEARRIEHVLGVRRHRKLGMPARVALALCGAPIVCLMASARPSPVQNIAPVAPAAAPLPEPSGPALPAPASIPQKSIPRARQIPVPCFGTCGPAATPQGPVPPAGPPIKPVGPSRPALAAAAPLPVAAAPPKAEPALPSPPVPPTMAAAQDLQSVAPITGDPFVIFTESGTIESGSSFDNDLAESLRNKIKGDFIWFEHQGDFYVIRDSATIAKAKQFFAPEEALGEQQRGLGRRQRALGKQQRALGEQMRKAQVKLPADLNAKLQQVQSLINEIRSGADMRQLGHLEARLGELQGEIGRLQGEVGREQGLIARQQGQLGREQGDLGRQQGELGRQQGELARQADRHVQQLLQNALSSGLAHRTPQ
jgi:beta-lactamase regulating signal transducer with metallopeptidase domain